MCLLRGIKVYLKPCRGFVLVDMFYSFRHIFEIKQKLKKILYSCRFSIKNAGSTNPAAILLVFVEWNVLCGKSPVARLLETTRFEITGVKISYFSQHTVNCYSFFFKWLQQISTVVDDRQEASDCGRWEWRNDSDGQLACRAEKEAGRLRTRFRACKFLSARCRSKRR